MIRIEYPFQVRNNMNYNEIRAGSSVVFKMSIPAPATLMKSIKKSREQCEEMVRIANKMFK